MSLSHHSVKERTNASVCLQDPQCTRCAKIKAYRFPSPCSLFVAFLVDPTLIKRFWLIHLLYMILNYKGFLRNTGPLCHAVITLWRYTLGVSPRLVLRWLNLNTRNDILLYFRHMYLTLRKTSELLKPIVVALQINWGVVLITRVSVVTTNSTGCDQLKFDSLLPARRITNCFDWQLK